MKHSIRLLAAAGVSLLAVATASAADLPSRRMAPVAAPVAFVPAFSWTGFYVGLQGGYQWASTGGSYNTVPAGVPVAYSYDPKGWLFGGHLGYNYQINQVVFGLEGDVEWSNVKRSHIAAAGIYHQTQIDWQASLRARLGLAVDRALIYVTGGLAYADMNYSQGNLGLAPNIAYSKSKFGYTVGAGVEYAFTNNITGRVEYRYTDFGRVSAANAAWTDSAKTDAHAVRVGASYKF